MAPRSSSVFIAAISALAFAAFNVPTVAHASPAPAPVPVDQHLQARASITALTSSQISAFKPYSWFSSTAYCAPTSTVNWTCGTNCQGNSDFIPVAVGGDGAVTQYCESF